MIRLTPVAPYQPAFVVALPHGIAAGVHLPRVPDPVPAAVLARLHPEEAALAGGVRAFRQVQFVGGRLAMELLFREMGTRQVPVLSSPEGAPILPSGLMGSITHKQDLAVAILARGSDGLGIDLEDTDHPRPGIAARVLRPEELAEVEALPADRQWCDTVLRFSVKEALYKAIAPFLRRYVDFSEVAVWPSPDGCDRVTSFLRATPFHDTETFQFDARHTWIGDRVLSTVRARREPR